MKLPPAFHTPADVFAWMEQACIRTFQPGLERMEWILERIDHPERRCRFIHIAGTNGKGSTAAMIASVLQAAGFGTGLFISPYVIDWSERIQYQREPIADSAFVRWSNLLRPHLEEMIEHGPGAPSPFEYWTLLALCYFAFEVCPEFVVWETGLGGRLDATNVGVPSVSVITQVGLDHQAQLGENRAEIAQEKAGIIKPGIPVVCGVEEKEALQVIQAEAKQKNSPLYTLHQDFSVTSLELSPHGQRFRFSHRLDPNRSVQLEIPLLGRHQLKNAATALMTLEVLRQREAAILDSESIRQGMRNVFWPGRLEKWDTGSAGLLLVLDGAHNRDGMEALALALQHHYSYRRLLLVLAMMRNKDIAEVLQPLLSMADLVLTTQVRDQPRSLSAKQLADAVKAIDAALSVRAFSSAADGVRWAGDEADPEDLILVTGSLYLVSEVRSLLIQQANE